MNNYPQLQWKVIGPDTSHWEGFIDTFQTVEAGASFIMPKAGGGTAAGNADAQFRNTWANARGLLKRSAFWWLTINQSIRQQAQQFAALLRDDPGEIEPYVDFEEGNQFWVRVNPVTGKRGINHLDISHLDGFISYFRDEFPVWPWKNDIGIYTGWGYWRAYGSTSVRFLGHPLWISDPDPVQEPDPVAPWNGDWHFWQTDYAAPGPQFGTDPNSAKGVDMNVYHGDALQFAAEYGGIVLPPIEPPTEGETMSQWYRVNADALNIRKGPGTSFLDIGDLYRNQVVEITSASGGWGRLNAIYDGTTAIALPDPASSWCSMSYLVATTAPVTPPPPPAETAVNIGLTIDAPIASLTVNGEVWTKAA